MIGNIPATLSGGQPPASRDEHRIFHANVGIATSRLGQETGVTVRSGLKAVIGNFVAGGEH
jgi:hypothetical protein